VALRWATAFLATEKHFRLIMGYKQLWILKSHLDGEDQLASARKVG